MEQIQLLNDKLDVLLKKYTSLQAENKRLKDTIHQQLQSIEQLNSKLHSVEQNLSDMQMGKTVSGGDEKQNMRRQLDNVIKEIDKILNTIDD